LVSPFWSIS